MLINSFWVYSSLGNVRRYFWANWKEFLLTSSSSNNPTSYLKTGRIFFRKNFLSRMNSEYKFSFKEIISKFVVNSTSVMMHVWTFWGRFTCVIFKIVMFLFHLLRKSLKQRKKYTWHISFALLSFSSSSWRFWTIW